MKQRAVIGTVAFGAAVVLGVLPAAAQETLAFVNAQVVNVRTGTVARGATVLVRGGRIVSVGETALPAEVRRLDVGGRYLVPGLIDVHTHLASLQAARRALESGVTTVRSASVGSFQDVALRELVRRGAIPGPDVVAAGLFVRPTLGEAVLADPAGLADLLPGVDTPEKLRHLVRVNLAHGVDVIKTQGTERAGLPDTDPRKQVYTEADLRVIVNEAATKGVPVACHAHGDEGARACVEAGVRSIEHGTYLSDATLARMKEKGIYLVPTLSTVVDLIEPGGDYDDPLLRNRGRHMLPRLRDTIRRARAMGVKIVTGADTSYGPASLTRIAHEVAAFVELGMTPLEAVQAATVTAAELLRLEKTTGAIEPGLEADLIAVDGNPLEDIVRLQDVLLVVSNGRIALNRLEFARPGGSSGH